MWGGKKKKGKRCDTNKGNKGDMVEVKSVSGGSKGSMMQVQKVERQHAINGK
jgi:hypothetical protein